METLVKHNEFIVFGDSHSSYFNTTKKLIYHIPWLKDLKIKRHGIAGASIVGLGKRESKLNVSEAVKEHIHKNSFNVFCFGQVDLELGYYYRKIVKGEDVSFENFIPFLVTEYLKFLKSLDLPPSSIVVKGLNLTVLKYHNFSVNYIKRIILPNIDSEEEHQLYLEKLKNNLDSFEIRNNATILFNRLLEYEVKKEGYYYFDINDFLSNYNQEQGIDDRFCPVGPDHHIIDSIEVRRIHFSFLKKLIENKEKK